MSEPKTIGGQAIGWNAHSISAAELNAATFDNWAYKWMVGSPSEYGQSPENWLLAIYNDKNSKWKVSKQKNSIQNFDAQILPKSCTICCGSFNLMVVLFASAS